MKESILGIPIDSLSLTDAVTKTLNFLGQKNLSQKNPKIINAANANVLVLAQKDQLLKKALTKSDILLPDGQGVVLASKIFGNGIIKEKVAGPDLFERLLEETRKKNIKLKIFFLGTTKQTLEKIKVRIEKEFKNLKFFGYAPPFKKNFSKKDSKKMITAINKVRPEILAVGMTAPKQEKWIEENKKKLMCKIILNIGATFDWFAGVKKRCPPALRQFEAFYRFLFEPRRLFRRMIRSVFIFPLLLIRFWLIRSYKKFFE